MRKAAAAPRCRRRIGLATIVLLGLSSLGFAASRALAAEPTPTTGTVTTPAPAPDPIPVPKPDPKPARPKPRSRATPPPPPPPPPATKGAAPRSTTLPVRKRVTRRAKPRQAAVAPKQARRAARPKTIVRKKPRAAAITPARRRAKPKPVQKVRRQARKQSQRPAAPTRPAFAPEPLPAPALTGPKSDLSVPVRVMLPLVGFGVLLLLGAAVASLQRVELPAVAEPLYAHRADVAALGFGALALALLLFNATVLF